MSTRRDFLKYSAAASASGLLPFSMKAPAAVKSGSSLSVAIVADPLTFDPHLAGNLQGRATTQAIHDTLLTVDKDGRLAPNLARIRNPDTGSIRGREIGTLDTVEVVDSHTIKLTLKNAFAAFLFPLIDVSGCIASPTALEKWGKDYGLHPAGTGPFKVAEYLKDAQSVLEKNGDYRNKGKPGVDQLILRPIPVDSTRLAELRSGGVQFAESLPLRDIQRLRAAGEIAVSEKVGFRWEYFGFNLRGENPGHSRKFRQAFQWAIDREALHQAAYFGTGSIGYDGILPGSPFHDADYRPFTPDMDMAKRLIDESGIDTPVTITASLRPDPVKQRAAQIFQATAEELGVKVEIEQTNSAGYRSTLRGGKMPIDLQGWWGYRPDPDQYLCILLHSTGSYAKRHGYNNPEMDKILDGERAAQNEAEGRTLFRKLADLMNEDAVYVPWHYSSDILGQHGAGGVSVSGDRAVVRVGPRCRRLCRGARLQHARRRAAGRARSAIARLSLAGTVRSLTANSQTLKPHRKSVISHEFIAKSAGNVIGSPRSGPRTTGLYSNSPCEDYRLVAASDWLRFAALDHDVILSCLRLCHVIGGLQPYPGLRGRAECLGQSDRHFARNAGAAVHDVRERLTADPQDLRAFGDAQAERLQAGYAHHLAGVRRVLHRHGVSPFISGSRSGSRRGRPRPRSGR